MTTVSVSSYPTESDIYLRPGYVADYVTGDDTGINFVLAIGESLSVSEVGARGIGKGIKETLAVAEARKFNIQGRFFESLNLSSVYHDNIAFNVSVFESFGVSDAKDIDILKALAEAFSTVDTRRFSLEKESFESLSFVEGHKRTTQWNRVFNELVSIAESRSASAVASVFELFGISEGRNASFEKSVSESIAVNEAMHRKFDVMRHFAESIGVAELCAKASSKPISESIGIYETMRRPMNAVISDIMISASDMTKDEFSNWLEYGSPAGYSPWRAFAAGDYTYREAMFRAVMKSTNSDRGVLTDFRIVVDTPDINDRGTVDCFGSGASVVEFSRNFHIVPEVTLSFKGGTVLAIPKLAQSPTKTGFSVVLIDPTTNQQVAGKVTWAAHGY